MKIFFIFRCDLRKYFRKYSYICDEINTILFEKRRAMNDSNTINKGSLPGLKEKRYLQKKAIIGFLYRMGELSKPEICRDKRDHADG